MHIQGELRVYPSEDEGYHVNTFWRQRLTKWRRLGPLLHPASDIVALRPAASDLGTAIPYLDDESVKTWSVG